MATTTPPQTPTTAKRTERVSGGVSTAIGFVGASAIALVSIAVCFDRDPPLLATGAAQAAVTSAGSGPVWLTTPQGEEIVWASGGRVSALPPWKDRPDAPAFVALAMDPVGLPSGEDAGPLAVSEPWVARRYGTTPPRTAAVDVADHLDTAKVEIVSGDVRRGCDTWRLGRWFCGPKAWHVVGPETLSVEGESIECLWLHPVEGGELRVTIPDLPAGGSLTGRVALSDEAAKTRGGSPVRFAIEVNGEMVTERTHPNKQGWSTFKAPLGKAASKRASVTFVVSAARTGKRHFCLQASIGGHP